jgi:hypothetical protein
VTRILLLSLLLCAALPHADGRMPKIAPMFRNDDIYIGAEPRATLPSRVEQRVFEFQPNVLARRSRLI